MNDGLIWQFRPFWLIAIMVAGILYGRGWFFLRQTPAGFHLAQRWATKGMFLLYSSSLAVLAFALLPPFALLAHQFFFLRMGQHLLLINVVPCFFFVTNPLPFIWYGVPAQFRHRLEIWSQKHPTWLTLFTRLTPKGIVLLLFIALSILWFDPVIHQATLNNRWLQEIEFMTSLSAGILYWWHIIAAHPRLHAPLPTFPQIAYTAIGALPIKITGLIFLLASEPIYIYPTPQLSWLSITPLTSYHWGGAIIWMLGGLVYSYSAIWLLGGWLANEEQKPPSPRSLWDTPESMLAPGWDR